MKRSGIPTPETDEVLCDLCRGSEDGCVRALISHGRRMEQRAKRERWRARRLVRKWAQRVLLETTLSADEQEFMLSELKKDTE